LFKVGGDDCPIKMGWEVGVRVCIWVGWFILRNYRRILINGGLDAQVLL